MKMFSKGSSETRTVGQALFKLSNLLQIAFGEAGSHVIKVNMVDGREMSAMVRPMALNDPLSRVQLFVIEA